MLYHRVAELPTDPQLLSVTPRHFAQHMEVLKQQADVLSLEALIHALAVKAVPPRAVVVTFDDGYVDNLSDAKPLLARCDVPATVFVTAHGGGAWHAFWWDELERLFLHPGHIPERLCLALPDGRHDWRFGRVARYGEAEFQRNRGWNVQMKSDPGPRQAAYRALCDLIRPMPAARRERVFNDLRAWSGREQSAQTTHRTLAPDELRRLAEGGLIEIGAHTVTHPVLATLSPSQQRAEIRDGKARLERILGRAVRSFSYPYGGRRDYTPETVSRVREARFTCACSNVGGTVGPGSDRFQLPRMLVRNWDAAAFARYLEAGLTPCHKPG